MKGAVVIILCVLATIIHAQEAEITPEATPSLMQPATVSVAALDGLELAGDSYLIDAEAPTVLLLHQLYTTRSSWDTMLPVLLDNGYNVLAVDVRGHGDTGGSINWRRAIDDVAVWFAWLREVGGVQPDSISTMGSSMGSTLAIIGCANDTLCRGTIAISPGWSYYGISIEDSLSIHPLLVIYAERDRWPALGVPDMIAAAPEMVTVYTYPGNAHGMNLVEAEIDTITPLILDWLVGLEE